MRNVLIVFLVALGLFMGQAITPQAEASQEPGGTFVDDDGSIHEGAIEALVAEGIIRGCNPPDNTRFCPDGPVTRGQLAAVISRAEGLETRNLEAFPGFRDVGRSHTFRHDISRLAAARITTGCNPPANDRYCPDDPVTRGQLAAFIVRTLQLSKDDGSRFRDVPRSHTFHDDIVRIATAGITRGCNPPANDRFCPDEPVTRAQLASMFQRAYGLTPITPKPRPSQDRDTSTRTADRSSSGGDTQGTIRPGRDIVGTPTGSIISGSVCATVNGNAILQGDVNLTCDLMVHGGVLAARPGTTVTGNGYSIEFMHGASADFQGTPTTTWWNNGASFNLERDINFNGVKRIMFHMGAAPSTIRYVRIDGAGGPQLGDYPLHFHLNGDTTRGTLVEGVVVSNSRQRAFVPHGSHGITFRDTIAYNIRGEAYWWDRPEFQSQDRTNNSNDTRYERALAHTVTNHPDDDRGFRLFAFELGAGERNVVVDSVARNVKPSNPKDCAGFGWPEIHHQQPRSWGFEGNASYDSACHGIFVWQNNNTNEHVVEDYRGDGISHGAYNSRFQYRDLDVDYVEVHAAGWTIDGGTIDTIVAMRHQSDTRPTLRVTDATIGSFVVNNAEDGGKNGGEYLFDNTTLTCAKVVWKDAVSGTRVVINGSTCPSR